MVKSTLVPGRKPCPTRSTVSPTPKEVPFPVTDGQRGSLPGQYWAPAGIAVIAMDDTVIVTASRITSSMRFGMGNLSLGRNDLSPPERAQEASRTHRPTGPVLEGS